MRESGAVTHPLSDGGHLQKHVDELVGCVSVRDKQQDLGAREALVARPAWQDKQSTGERHELEPESKEENAQKGGTETRRGKCWVMHKAAQQTAVHDLQRQCIRLSPSADLGVVLQNKISRPAQTHTNTRMRKHAEINTTHTE